MTEITFKNLANYKRISLKDNTISVDNNLLHDVKEIEFFQANEFSTHLLFKNEQNTVINKVLIGSTQKLLVNNNWQYIKLI